DADLGAVVAAHRPGLELHEEMLAHRLRLLDLRLAALLRLLRRQLLLLDGASQPLEQGEALGGRGLQERLARGRARERVHRGQARAMIVQVGFWQDALTWLEPSTTNRFFTSWLCWCCVSTDFFGSAPMRAVPSSWMDHPSVRTWRSVSTTSIFASSNISRAVLAMSSAIFFSFSPNLKSKRRTGTPHLSLTTGSMLTAFS